MLLRGELLPLRRKVKHVDSLVAFRVDQRHFDVARQARQRRTDLIEQSRMVLGNDFEQRAVRRRRIVEVDARLDGDLGCAPTAGAFAAFQEWFQRRLSIHDICEALAEALSLAGVQLQSAVQICEVEGVQHDAGGIREGIRLVDVHAPAGQHARYRREKCRAVRREQRQGETVAGGEDLRLHGIRSQLLVKRQVRRNLRRRMHREIPPRESFEEPLDLFEGGAARQRLHPLEQRAFIRRVQAVAIQRAAEVV